MGLAVFEKRSKRNGEEIMVIRDYYSLHGEMELIHMLEHAYIFCIFIWIFFNLP